MSAPEVKITITHKHINGRVDAFAVGLAEWLGRGMAFTFFIVLLTYGFDLPKDDCTVEDQRADQLP